MEKFFRKDNIQFVDTKTDWKNALNIAVNILIKNNSATEKLYDAIIESTEKYGPYYILVPKIALAHAEPNTYSLKADISVVFFRNEIDFKNDDAHKVKIIIGLSAPDSNSHLAYLQEFVKIFSNENLKQKLLKVKNESELIEILKGENLW